MFRISEAAAAFAKLNNIDDDATPALDKLLRNLTQRHYLPPSAREGRADLYSIETICALRLAERAATFGIDRVALDGLLRFLHSAPSLPTRFRRGDGVHVALTHIEEAVERARASEDFVIGLTLDENDHVVPKAWFPSEELTDDARAILANTDRPHAPDAVFSLNAGRMIRAVLAVLNAE
ncbi:hypothetical protein NJB93_04170 [Brucella intermedia]|uniref:hypothetical protein n=1 Tax=Brucella intermedia TaxID=94625 RepID=UPI0020973201|nr:hypothetical protein [Brucella intermedia]MCO7725787.1 hypothetical protein [Brucella intermedia]